MDILVATGKGGGVPRITPDRRQSKTLLTIDERGSRFASVFDAISR